ncbi:VaFE repeat-containing surface-anchored protein [Candidatus Saccharibacteria bacterium]|nr:VaFE repeat-containing surface-anchored protein [Candidatus Saccharibacteria bacterium]
MFRLSYGKKLFRFSAVGIIVAAVVALAGTLVARQAEQETSASSALGSTATMSFDPNYLIYYGTGPTNTGPTAGSYTPIFYVGAGSTTYRGYCLQPHVRPVAGQYTVIDGMYGNYQNAIKLIMYINEVDNYYTRAARASLFNTPLVANDNDRYAWTHAIISMMTPINVNIYGTDFYNTTYGGSNWGLSASEIAYAEGAIAQLQNYISSNAIVWRLASQASLYYIDGGANSGADGYRHQDVAWIEVPEQAHGNIQIQKCDSDTTSPNCLVSGRDVSGIKFALYNNTGSWIYLEEYDDFVSGTWNPNASDNSAARLRFNSPDGQAVELVTNANGQITITDLVPGNYILVETETNSEYELTASPQNVTVTANGTTQVRVENDHIVEYSISTQAYDGSGTNTTDKYIEVGSAVIIKDNVTYCGDANSSYRIQGKVMNKNTGTAITNLSSPIDVRTGSNGCGTSTVTYTVDTRQLGGVDLVVFEYLTDGTDTLVSHEELNDPDQTVTVISLGTTAVDNADNDKYVDAISNAVIKDTVSYCLKAGKTYTIRGVLMEKDNSSPSMIGGSIVEGSVTITPTTACGTTTMTFGFDAREYAGEEVVVFERVYEGNNLIIEHADINDGGQTIDVVSLGTTAVDAADDDKYINDSGEVTIVDYVDYCLKALPQDATTVYELYGVLMDKSTGEPLLIDGEKVETTIELRPEQNCGRAEMEFTFDASGLGGTDIVVFETVYYGDTEIVSHEDIDDEDQLIEVLSIKTVAIDKADGDKTIIANKDAAISDTVSYCLRANRDYVIASMIVDQETGESILFDDEGDPMIFETEITPETDCGEVVIDYTFDATGLEEHKLVIVAAVFYDDEAILVHDDLDNEDQTISVIPPEIPDTGFITKKVQGGTEQGSPIVLSVAAASILIVGFASARVIRRRRILR